MAFAQYGKYVGGDISILPSYEASNTVYLDAEGNKISDLIPWLMTDCGWNTFRVRLFVNPQKKHANGSWDPAVCQDIEYVKTLGKRIKNAGALLMLDIHYSDTWVDAGHIQAPAECSSMTAEEKAEWISSYTKSSLEALNNAGATPDFVQVGNEIMYGFMGIKVAPYNKSDSRWDDFLKVLKAGCDAVREVCPESQIIIHTDRPTNSDYAKYWYGKLDAAGVPYDIIGLSYYPFWHGYLSDLGTALTQLKADFPTKKVQIVETAYYFQYWPTSGINYNTQNTWACSADGQHKFVKDLIAELAKHENVDGLSYWCPEEAGSGDNANWDTNEGVVLSGWLNRGLWWSKSNNGGHWPLTSNGTMTVSLLRDFLSPSAAGIETIRDNNSQSLIVNSQLYNLSGQKINSDYKGIVIVNGKKYLRRY